MGCPYEASLIIGFKIEPTEAKKIEKKLAELEEKFPANNDWEKEIGTFDPYLRSDEDDSQFYLELCSINNVSNCEFIGKISDKSLASAKKEAEKIYDESPFLKDNFKKSDIALLLISDYIG